MTSDGDTTAGRAQEMARSSRDHSDVRDRLERWLAGRLPEGAEPRITGLEATSATGMSNETLLLSACWQERGEPRQERLVARLAPDQRDVPVFPSYDLERQFEVIRLVGELSDVPVPRVWWSEPNPGPIGTPFFLMGHVDGRVPPDVMPYTFGDNWLHDADETDQRCLQDATVSVLARLHAVDGAEERFAFLRPDAPGDTPLRRRVATARAWYDFAAADGFASPLVEQGFAWLDAHWPATEGETVLSWGDARIGNVLYDGFTPAAVLDWEMATLGPRELDLGWLIYAHCIFNDIAGAFGLPGMPGFMRAEDVAAGYEALTGHRLGDLAFYGTLAALQYGIVFLRTGARSVHFGELEPPDQVDDLLHNREGLERMLAGEYWT